MFIVRETECQIYYNSVTTKCLQMRYSGRDTVFCKLVRTVTKLYTYLPKLFFWKKHAPGKVYYMNERVYDPLLL